MSHLKTSELRRIFKSLDQNDDGLLSLDELSLLLVSIGVHASSDELAALVGKDGLNFDDFFNFYNSVFKRNCTRTRGKQNANAKTYNNKCGEQDDDDEEDIEIYKAFKVFELDGDGLISSQELQTVLWKLGMWDKNGALDCDQITHEYDVNSDGFVDFDEFKQMIPAY